MIELIFVIVIIGILAAVAIPKLAATRDDAQDAKTCANIATCITDVVASYTATGTAAYGSPACSDANISAASNESNGTLTISGSPTRCDKLDGNTTFSGSRIQ